MGYAIPNAIGFKLILESNIFMLLNGHTKTNVLQKREKEFNSFKELFTICTHIYAEIINTNT